MPIPLGVLAVAGAGAAGGGAAFDLLETTILGTATESVTFSNLNTYSSYKHLQIRAVTRNTGGNDVGVRFNGDTTNSYASHALAGQNGNVSSFDSSNSPAMYLVTSPGGSESMNYGAQIIEILDFNSTTKNTTIRTLMGYASSNEQRVRLSSGLYNKTDAITSVSVVSWGGNTFSSGSRFSLYGIR